jgi:proline dehydrogenase
MMINQAIARILPLMPKQLVWIFSKKYISGETLADALRESRKLNAEGCTVTVDVLGEFVSKIEEADQYKREYIEVVEKFSAAGIKGNVSVKPTMFGLLLDKEACYDNIREIVRTAAENDSFIRIDMEDSTCTDDEIDLFLRLKKEFPHRVGLVLQAYMRRTHDDIKNLMKAHSPDSPLNFRLCKGIYVEDESIAYKGYQEIRDHYLEDLEFILKEGIFVGIATHDTYLVDNAIKMLESLGIPKDRYEFQMLYGVSSNLRRSIVDKGHPLKVYVPFGKQWFRYSTRRLKENPHMVWHIVKAIFVRS